MRTITLVDDEHLDLIAALDASLHPAAPRFAARVREAQSCRVYDSGVPLTFKVEGHDGTMRECHIGDFHTTGVARDWPDAKAEVAQCGHTMGLSLVGYFRTPQGHLAEASRFQYYLDLERAGVAPTL